MEFVTVETSRKVLSCINSNLTYGPPPSARAFAFCLSVCFNVSDFETKPQAKMEIRTTLALII